MKGVPITAVQPGEKSILWGCLCVLLQHSGLLFWRWPNHTIPHQRTNCQGCRWGSSFLSRLCPRCHAGPVSIFVQPGWSFWRPMLRRRFSRQFTGSRWLRYGDQNFQVLYPFLSNLLAVERPFEWRLVSCYAPAKSMTLPCTAVAVTLSLRNTLASCVRQVCGPILIVWVRSVLSLLRRMGRHIKACLISASVLVSRWNPLFIIYIWSPVRCSSDILETRC